MNAQKHKQYGQGSKKKKPFRRIAWGIGIAAGILLLLLLTVPWILSSSGGTDFLLGWINRSLDGTLGMEDLSVGWLSGVQITKLTFEDTTGQTRVRVDSIRTHPNLLGLMGGRLSLGETVVDRPDVQITLPPPQVTETEKKPAPAEKKDKRTEFPLDSVDLEVRDGRAVIEQLRPSAESLRVEVRNFASTVRLQEPGKESSLDVSMELADSRKEATLQAKGAATTTAGQWGLKGLSGQFEMEIDSLSLETLRPLMALAGKEVDMAGMLNADADVKISDGQIETLNANAVLENFQQVIAGKITRLDQPVRAEAKISTKGKDIVIDALSVDSSFCRLDGKGGLNAIDYTLTADLAKTQEVTAALVDYGGYNLKGSLSGSGKVRRQDETFTASGQNEIRDFSVQQGDKAFALASITKTYDLAVNPTAQTLQITNASINAPPGQLQVAGGAVDWSKDKPLIQMKMTGSMDLQQARPIVNFFHPLPAEVSIAGIVRPNLSIDMKEGQARIVTDGTAIDNLKVTKEGSSPFVSKTVTLKADALIDLENKQLQQLRNFELISDPVKLRGSLQHTASAKHTTLSGAMDAEYDLQEVTVIASPYLPEGLSMEGKRKDRFEFQSTYPTDQPEKKMENLSASGQFGFAKADYMGLHIGPAEMKIRSDQGLLAVDLADTTVNEGILRFAGDIDLTAEPKMLRLRKPMTVIEQVNVNDEVTHNFLEYVNPFLAGATRVSGIANFSCDQLVLPLGKTRKDLLNMKANLGIRNLKLQPAGEMKKLMEVIRSDSSAMLTLHPTDLVLQNEVLSYQDMQLDVGDNPLNFMGTVGLDRKLNLTMKLPWTTGGQTVKTGREAANRITLPVGGTIDKPQIDWGKVLQYNLENVLQREIQDQLERIFK